ncbi:MAG: hypothetical protein HY842_05630 [Bacteroidetes bacterium]|nr:hypothetical protein [Bacteroidota bacterium]
MKVYIDENLPPQLARGLHILQQPLNQREREPIEVKSIKDEFGQGTQDEDWIPKAGKENAIIITQDYRIQRDKNQFALYQEHGLGVFFFKPPSKNGFTYWQMVEQVVKRWEELKKLASKEKRPFAFRCSSRADFEKI